MDVVSVSTLNDLPKNASLLIYGAGGRGLRFAQLLAKYRGDVKILGFLDSNKSGTFQQYTVHHVESVDTLLQEHTGVIVAIASTYANQIYCNLLKFKLDVVYNVNAYMVSPNKFRFSSENMRQAFCEKVRGIAHIFRKQADRDYLNCICDMHTDGADASQDYRALMDFFTTLDEQYFDHINKQAIKTIIDGGMENGGTSLRFLHHFPGCTVHAFEPLAAAVKLSPFYSYIQGCEQIRLVFKGLADTPSSGMLNINPDCFGGNTILDSSACEYSERIETTTIDDYAAETGIAKIDFIKLDIESFEIKALHGAKKTIAKDRPQMAICIYHKPEHYYEIPLLLSEMCIDYNFYLGFYGVETFLESVLYCIPKELDSNA